ncbi:MAG: hypothetical protein IJZ60_05955 [Bacteroides sp.]|nr:hypothetical protein [Bacteroides sp.]
MKKNLIYAGMLLLGMTVATGCSNEESLEQVLNGGTTIQAVIESATEARTSVNDAYEVTWTAGDAFNVWNGDTKAGTLTLSEGVGTTSGKFTASDDLDLQDGSIALFPASNSKNYTFATAYTSQETDAPMLGTFANGKFTFSLLTSMVRVVVADVPVGEAVLTISSNSETLTGEATLGNDNTLGVPASGTKEVTVTMTNAETATLTFDVPVPAQNYTNGLSVKLTVGGTEVFSKTTNAFDAAVGKIYVFGATYVSVDGDNVEATLQEALNDGEVVVLTGTETEVAVSSLTLPAETTATIELNSKTLKLGESASTMALGRSTSEAGIVNNGTLTLSNGSIEYTGDYAIMNKGVLTLDEVNLTASYVAVKNVGVWESGMTVQKYKGTDAAVKFTMNGGSITSTTDVNNVYAIQAVDYCLVDIQNAEIKGSLNAGGLQLNCAEAKLDDVTITRGTSGTSHQVHVIAGVLTYTNTTIDNYRYYYGDSKGKYGYAEVNGVYYGEVNTQISASVSDSDALKSALTNVEDGGVVVLANDITSSEQLTFNNTGKTLTLDLNGKTLSLSSTYGLVNKAGKLIIMNGKISGSCSYATLCNWAGSDAIETELNKVELTASYIAVYNKGVWESGKTVQDYKGTDATVKFTMNGGSITSNTTATDANVYAVMSNDYSLTTINDATITGTSTAGGLHLNCAEAKLNNVTITRGTSGTAHQVCAIPGVLTTTDTTINNYRYYYGDSKGTYGYAEVNGTYYGEVNQVVSNPSAN